ncbi:cytochrome P450 [Mycena maculata]|uniref:Cytochrome P450 n=1 Tax=Mycena maculata TaxID=230809 RepID=A0AAD7INX9_9AGAR|nr:cytochrome P450 [Mycena maculata]
MHFTELVASIIGTLGAYALYRLLKAFYQEFTSPLSNVPGPSAPENWLIGHRAELQKPVENGEEGQWTEKYGRTMRVKTVFGFSQLYTTDTRAVHHILTNNYIYQKPPTARYVLGRLVGPGVLVVEEDVHKQQRKILNPAFGPQQIRALTGIFVDKSKQLRDIWASQAAVNGGRARVEIIPWLTKATLDMIGLAGFNHNFNSLGNEGTRDELQEAFEALSAAGGTPGKQPIMAILKSLFPAFRIIPTKADTMIEDSQEVMNRIGRKLMNDSKEEIARGVTSETGRSRDLFSLLVRANTSKDIPETQRLSDADVLAQVPTFLVAGHETTSTAATWALFSLAENVEIQTRLRNELLTLDTDEPSMDELNSLQYLDCVVRETLRVHAPVVTTQRMAMRDDVIPLGTPFTDRNGIVLESLRIKKGQPVLMPILVLNRDPEIWGPDARQFIPERWQRSPPISTSIPGIWGQMLTFQGGPRACIGFRFSLVELKALLFTLVRALEFELAVPAADIGRIETPIVQQPVVRSDRAAGTQMPLLIKLFDRSSAI